MSVSLKMDFFKPSATFQNQTSSLSPKKRLKASKSISQPSSELLQRKKRVQELPDGSFPTGRSARQLPGCSMDSLAVHSVEPRADHPGAPQYFKRRIQPGNVRI